MNVGRRYSMRIIEGSESANTLHVALVVSRYNDFITNRLQTGAEAALLRQQGVDLLQGYHLGKPTIDRPWKVKRVAKLRLGKSDEYRIYSSAAY